jgi:hypothetical protein
MPKITLNLEITKKKNKKRKNVKKYKEKIGRDLIKDTVGTNQLLDFNDLNNLLEANQSINTDDQNKYYDYIDNLRAQQAYQLYGGDPNEQYQLKKVSKKLYNNLKNSLFDDGIRQDNIVGPPPDDEPIISNSWDAVPGGTATSIGSFRPRPSFVEPVENIGSSSSVQIVDAYNFPTADVVDFDPILYTREQIKIKLSKDKYMNDYPSNPTIVKWFAPIKNKINDEGFVFGENYKQVVRDVYAELYPNSVHLIKTPVKKTPVKKEPEPKEEPKETPEPKSKPVYYNYGEEAFAKPKLPIRRPKTKPKTKPPTTKKDIYKMFETDEQLMNYSTEIPKPLKLKQQLTKEEIKKQRAINKAEKEKIKEEKKQRAINKKEKKELEKEEKELQKVLNPKTNKMVKINTKAGRKILKDQQQKKKKFKKAL